MNKEAEEKETMECEKFVAGALLKFKTLDNVDFSLLVEDFEKKIKVVLDPLIDEALDKKRNIRTHKKSKRRK